MVSLVIFYELIFFLILQQISIALRVFVVVVWWCGGNDEIRSFVIEF